LIHGGYRGQIRLDGLRGFDRRAAQRRHRHRKPRATGNVGAPSLDMERRMDRRCDRFRRVDLDAAWTRRSAELLHRLLSRRVAVDRQPRRLRAGLRTDRHRRAAAAQSAHVGGRRRAADARHADCSGALYPAEVSMGRVSVRRASALCRRPDDQEQHAASAMGRNDLYVVYELGREAHTDHAGTARRTLYGSIGWQTLTPRHFSSHLWRSSQRIWSSRSTRYLPSSP
jgi:hypothetical protein